MERIRLGDAFALRILVARYLPKAHAIARRILPLREDAEEAVQDAFSKVWVNAYRFDASQAAFGTWFYRMLTNACLDIARKRPVAAVDIATVGDIFPDTVEGQEAALATMQDGARVQRAVQALPEQQRIAVTLCYFEEMSNAGAAAIMGVHIKALEGLLVRARKHLRGVLGE